MDLLRNFIILIILTLTSVQKCFSKILYISPFATLNYGDLIKRTYGIEGRIVILNFLSIGSDITQSIINNDNYQKNITNNIVAENFKGVVPPEKFNYYDLNLKIRTPEVLKSRIIFSYNQHNIFEKDDILYISQNMMFFEYKTYNMEYEINFESFLLNIYYKQNRIQNNIKDCEEYGINYIHNFGSSTKFTIGYSYSHDILKNNFDDGVTIKYLKKQEDFLYFKYDKKIAQINKNLLINNVHSVKLISDFKISDNINVKFSLTGNIDNHKNKSLFFGFGLSF